MWYTYITDKPSFLSITFSTYIIFYNNVTVNVYGLIEITFIRLSRKMGIKKEAAQAAKRSNAAYATTYVGIVFSMQRSPFPHVLYANYVLYVNPTFVQFPTETIL